MKNTTFLLVMLLMAQLSFAYSVEEVPNVKLHCQGCYVSNPDTILSPSAVNQMNRMLTTLEGETGVEIAVVVINTIGVDDYYDFAYRLFNYWEIGKSGKDNGVLILFVADERAVKIETGYGVEGLLPDITCESILNDVMFPLFKEGKYDDGFIAGIQAISDVLTTEEAKEELLLSSSSGDVEDFNMFSDYLMLSFALLLLMTWILYRKLSKLRGARNIKYRDMASFSKFGLVLGIFFWPVLFIYFWLRIFRHKMRYDKFVCDKCGEPMHLLNEKDDDAYLSPEKQTEERVRSVDYDVWVCDKCQNKKILSYAGTKFGYTTCPKCGAKTYKLENDVVTSHPTTLKTGRGIKKYHCKHCNHTESIAYIIPIIVLSSSSSSGGSSSSSDGGSWGGGHSGGGGAGGRF